MRRWRCLLRGSLAGLALEAALTAAPRTRLHHPSGRTASGRREAERTNAESSLAEGAAGEAIFGASLAATPGNDAFAAIALALVSVAVARTRVEGRDSSFFGGFPGVGWCARRLGLATQEPETFFPDVDEEIERILSVPLWRSEFDLVNGLVGYGVYALERLPEPAADRALGMIVRHLAATAESVDGGLAWRTPARQIPPALRRGRAEGHFDLGMAHGVPGVVAFLAQAVAADAEAGVARELLEGAVSWLLSPRRRAGASLFPFHLVPGKPPEDCRAAWCYGDPGIAAGLLLAARLVGQSRWEREALAIARHAAVRDPDSAGASDHGLCHGSAGLGHVFNRLFQATGDEMLRRAAVSWFERTLATWPPARTAGKRAPEEQRVRRHDSRPVDRSFLTGTSGTGLALIAAATPIEPAWDRALLLSSAVSPRSARRGQ